MLFYVFFNFISMLEIISWVGEKTILKILIEFAFFFYSNVYENKWWLKWKASYWKEISCMEQINVYRRGQIQIHSTYWEKRRTQFCSSSKKMSTNILFHYYKTRTHYSLHRELHFVFIFFLCNEMLYFRVGSLDYLWLLFRMRKMGNIFFLKNKKLVFTLFLLRTYNIFNDHNLSNSFRTCCFFSGFHYATSYLYNSLYF